MPHSHRSRKHGFTLVELLVVIGIIALLISILLPALSKARKSANTVKCLAQHKQLMTAFILYSSEWKGAIPWPGFDAGAKAGSPLYPGWLYDANNRVGAAWDLKDLERGSLYTTLGLAKAYRCPDDSGPFDPNDITYLTTYVMNGCLCANANYPRPAGTPSNLYKITRFKPDTAVFWEIGSGPGIPTGQKNDSCNRPSEGITIRHQKGTTISFLDGHAEVWRLDVYVTEMNMVNGSSRLWRNPEILSDGGASAGGAPNITSGVIGSGATMIYAE